MKKKYLLIGIGIILLILATSWYKQQQFACGDGVCHQKKEFKTGICPQDCGVNTLTISDVDNLNQPPECQIKSIVELGEGSFPKWSPDGNLIAFNKLVNGKVYEIFTMRPDGSDVKCLTCNKPQLPQNGHKGQPYWHPSGQYIVFTVQNTNYKILSDGYAEQPDAGRSHNVWIMTADSEKFWQLTDYPQNWGVIKPTFSNDGTKVFWNEEYMMEKYPQGKWTDVIPHPGTYWNYLMMIFRRGEELGAWRVVYADITFDEGPKISNIKKVNPPANFTLLEASGLTPDGKGFIYSYDNLKMTAGVDFWGDIYTTDLDGNSLTQLTFSAYNHDENAEYSPDGQKIAWSSSPGLPGTSGVDIYLMDADSENKSQLTHFGEKSNKDYLGDDYSCRELGWSPDGKQIAVSFGTNYRPYLKNQSYYFDNLYLLTFQGACGRL